MADSKFFKKNKPSFTAQELAELTQSKIVGDGSVAIQDIATLDSAGAGHLSFFSNAKYKKHFTETKASVCICDEQSVALAPSGVTLLINSNPYFAYAQITQAFYKEPVAKGYIANTAAIYGSATISENVHISDFAVIGKNCKIGKNVFIGANTTIGEGCEIDEGCKIMHNVTLTHCIIGKNSVIFSGCRIGQDGFGYAPSAHGITKVEQLGKVVIGNSVEVGANTTIDRGAIADTIIGDGTKIDNLVQIGHNVIIGKNCIIVAQAAIAGSAVIEDAVMIAGQAGVAGHLVVGRGAKVAAKSGVIASVGPGAAVGGMPAIPIWQWHRITAMLKRMTTREKG